MPENQKTKENNMKTKMIFSVLALLCASPTIQAQAAVLYGGIAKLTNQDKLITPDGMTHPGFMIGIDGMLSRTGLNLMAGLQYHQYHFMPTKNSAFFGMDQHLSHTKLRFGMNAGFKLSKKMLLRFYGLGSAALLTHLPLSDKDIPQKSMNDAYGAAVGGVSFSAGPGIISVEYEKGLSDASGSALESRNNSLALTLGFIF